MNETTIPASTPCPNCKGRGGWDLPEDCIVCEVCGGSGRVRNDTPAPPAPAAGSGATDLDIALDRWRQLSAPWWRKHHRAGANMMRWMHAPGWKARRRLKKWANEYERTIVRMPNPPDAEAPNSMPASPEAQP